MQARSLRTFIVDQLVAAPFLSSAQVLDHLKEHFPDLPSVSERTVYNVVRRIREEEDCAQHNEELNVNPCHGVVEK